MAFIGAKWAVPATVLVIFLYGPSLAEDTISSALPSAHLQSKVAYCKTCHGLSGEGYRGYYPMPRLAGQQTEYLESQLRDFAEGRRRSPLMFNVARVLNPSMRSKLAAHFRELNPKPIDGAPRERQASLVSPDTSVFMESIAQSLSEAQIAAVAAYLSNLE
jgi:cytochrome c553